MAERVFFDDSGGPSPLPTSKEDAKRSRYPWYMVEDNCAVCGGPSKYVDNDRCLICSRIEGCDFHAYAIGALQFRKIYDGIQAFFPADEVGPPPRMARTKIVSEDFKSELEDERRRWFGDRFARSNPGEAHEAGQQYFAHPDPCRKRGHFGVRTLKNRCAYCEEIDNRPSPRQEAIKAGKRWYVPDTPCTRCDTRSERRVSSGECKGCTDKTKAEGVKSTPDAEFMRQCPDVVVTKEQARMWGMKVYRTGEPCKHGHAGFRYVSTNGCIDCLRA